MFKILDEVCKPTKGSKYSAAVDLYAREDVVIRAGETVKVPLGICIDSDKLEDLAMIETNIYFNYTTQEIEDVKYQFLESHYLQLEPRSSLRAKGLIAGTGIIDLDYKDEIMIILHNPIQYIDKIVDINKNEDYIEIDYMGSPTPRRDGIQVKYSSSFKISKGDKIAQIMLCEHKTYLMGIESDVVRTSGFGSTGLWQTN